MKMYRKTAKRFREHKSDKYGGRCVGGRCQQGGGKGFSAVLGFLAFVKLDC
jgi:hypothetical protein